MRRARSSVHYGLAHAVAVFMSAEAPRDLRKGFKRGVPCIGEAPFDLSEGVLTRQPQQRQSSSSALPHVRIVDWLALPQLVLGPGAREFDHTYVRIVDWHALSQLVLERRV